MGYEKKEKIKQKKAYPLTATYKKPDIKTNIIYATPQP